MVRRFLLLLALLVAAPSLAQPVPQRIVAVGDLHGDYAAWIDIARDAGLIDASIGSAGAEGAGRREA